MMQVFESMNEFVNPWGEFLWGIAWQAGVIGLLIATVVIWKKRWGSSLKYWLLVVALVKFLVPPFLALPTGILGHSSAYITAAFQTVSTSAIPRESARTNVTPAVREGRPSPAVLPPESTEMFIPEITEPIASVPKRTDRVQTSARAVVVESAPEIPWGSIAFVVYLTGVIAGGVLILRQRIRLAGIVSRSVVAATETLGIDIGSIPVQLRTRKQPCILISEEVGTPMAFGILRPTILLPKADWDELSMLDRRTVLYHEWAHLRRRDPLINGMQLIVRTIWWCHPVAHLVNGLLVKVREECCDDLLLREELASPVEYSEVLLRSVSRFRPAGLPMVLEMARHPLEPRLRRILDGNVLRLPRLDLRQMCLLLLVAAVMLPGLRSSAAVAQQEKAKADPTDQAAFNPVVDAPKKDFTIQGKSVDSDFKTPVPGVKVLLYKAEGFFSPAEKIAETVSGEDGSYEFKGLAPPRIGDRLLPLQYLCFGIVEGRAVGSSFAIPTQNRLSRLVMVKESGRIKGRVVNERGEPVSGAVVTRMAIGEQYVPEIQKGRTDQEGHFTVEGIPVFRKGALAGSKYQVQVLHEDYPTGTPEISSLDEFMVVKLKTGCDVTGSVNDGKTGQPAAGIVVTFQDINESKRFRAQTDSRGRYRKVIPEGRYHITAESADRVSVAILDHECLRGEKLELPQFTMIEGGFIEGRVLNTKTSEPVFVNQSNDPIGLGLFGPASPRYRAISPIVLTEVDAEGRYRLRAAPGENYPYFVNQQGDRMAWDTQKQPSVLVKSGETTPYDMLITPPVPATDRMKQSREIVSALPTDIPARTMTIKVVDENRMPIKDAKVFRNHVYRPTLDKKTKIENETYFTSNTGEAKVELSGKSVDLRLWVSKSDYVKLHAMWAIDSQSDGDQIPAEFTFMLKRGHTIGGKIIDFEGKPIAGATVEVQLKDDGTHGYSDRADRTQPGIRPVFDRYLVDSDRPIVTDEQGNWTINNTPDLEEFFNSDIQEPFFGFENHRVSPVSISVSHPKYVKFESGIDQNQDSELTRRKLIELSSQIYLLPEKKARRKLESPTSETEKRVADILISLNKLKNSVDDIRASISHIRELVSIGPEAVPLLVEELDETTEDLMIVRLAFSLRAIGDPRAVPGLIRVLPKTLFTYRTGIGLFIDDPELTRFMKRYDLQNKDRENHFSFGSPYREVMGALQKLTGRDAGRLALNWVRLSQSPRRADLQRELFRREAQVWEHWWKEHCRELTPDEKYYEVDLDQHAEFLPPRIDESTIQPRLKSEFNGMTLSPFNDQTKFRTHFYDIDTGYSPAGPEPLPKNEEEIDFQKLGEWAKKNGVDLMCVSHRSPEGTISYELRGFDLAVWDISSEDVEEMRRSIDNVEFPSGDPVGEVLIPIDSETKERTPGTIGAFAFITREGTKGIIEIGDRVTEVRDLTGQFGDVKGVGFHLGVRFNLSTVVP